MEWFPALRKRLAARGVHLPDPYPYTARTFKGSVLATLLAAILFLIAYAVWEAASYTARSELTINPQVLFIPYLQTSSSEPPCAPTPGTRRK